MTFTYISADTVYAEIKEELSSYFTAGAIDDLMFPIWTDYCLKRLRKATYIKKTSVVNLKKGKGVLPDDFNSLISAWTCQSTETTVFSPRATYKSYDTRLTPTNRCDCVEPLSCDCNPCKPDSEYQVTYKHNEELILKFKVRHLLKPGNVITRENCASDCLNNQYTTHETFELDGCNIYTSLGDENVFLEYYAQSLDEDGNPKIPDNIYIKSYIISYIKYKLFEKLLNTTTDETFNTTRYKYELAKSNMNQAYVHADIELKKQTKSQIRESIHRNSQRFNRLRNLYR